MVQGPLAGCQVPSWRGGGLEALLGRPLGCVLASSSSTRPAAWSMLFTAVLAAGIATACLLQGVKRRHPAVRRFRVVRRERVLPVARTGGGVHYPLSVLDKMLCPMIVINMHFFYQQRIDAQRVKASLARLITRHPFLGGTLKGYLSWATVSCDDRGVEVVEQEADFSRQDLHFRSIALERLSSAEPCGFGAGRALDLLQAFFWGAPVLRVRISYLRDGGSALSVSVGHTVMDAKSIMKIIEVWAVDTREPLDVTEEEVQHHIARRQHYQQQQQQAARHPRRPSDAAAPAPPQMLRTPSTAPPQPQREGGGGGARGGGGGLSSATGGRYGSSILLDAKEMEELATAHSGAHRLSLWELWRELCNSMGQSVFMIRHFLLVGLQTRTLFFPDHMVAQLKDQVMADIKQQQQQDQGEEEEEEGKAPGGKQQQPVKEEEGQQAAVAVGAGLVVKKQPSSSRRRSSGGGPSFVSSNDVVTAAFWKLLQSLECRPRGPSCMRMNVDVRAMIARPMLRARLTSHSGDLSSLPSPSSSSSEGGLDSSLSSSTASTASTASSSSDLPPSAASSPGLLSLLERDPLPESFFIGNGVLQVTACHEHPQDASISELAQAVRGAVSSMDAATALKELGALKKKIRHMDNLGILLGPMGCDWRFDRDVVFSSFNPLSIDADFGAGPSHTYHLDLLPALNMYTHIHRGVDVNSGKAGLFVQTTLPRPVMSELLAKHPHLLPAMPPPDQTTPRQQHKEEEGSSSSRHPPLAQQQQEALPSPIPIATAKPPPPARRPAVPMAEEQRAQGQQQQHLEDEDEEVQAEDQGDEEEEEEGGGGSRTRPATAEPPSPSPPPQQQQQLSPDTTTCSSSSSTSSRLSLAALVEPSAS